MFTIHKFGVVGHLHTPTKISFLDVVQYLNLMVEKVFELHASRLVPQAKPPNYLIVKVGALGNSFKVVPQAQAALEVLIGPLWPVVLGGTHVPFCDSNALEAAAEKIKLLVEVIQIVLVVLVPSYMEFCHEKPVWCTAVHTQEKLPFVRGSLAGHLASTRGGL